MANSTEISSYITARENQCSLDDESFPSDEAMVEELAFVYLPPKRIFHVFLRALKFRLFRP